MDDGSLKNAGAPTSGTYLNMRRQKVYASRHTACASTDFANNIGLGATWKYKLTRAVANRASFNRTAKHRSKWMIRWLFPIAGAEFAPDNHLNPLQSSDKIR